jgi:hypothetical protein
LSGVSEEEILAELKPQEVSGVRRISFPKGERRIPTNTLVITFSTIHLPKTIKVGYLLVKVQVYIPNPMRCFGCQRFGHHETKCRSDIRRCKKCGEDEDFHSEFNCPNKLKCVNCNGPHEVTSKECPEWKKEKEVLKVKYTQNISFPEARKIVNEKYTAISKQQSYASITKANAHTSVELVDSCTQFKENDVQTSDKIIIPTIYKQSESSVKTTTQSSTQQSQLNKTTNKTNNSKHNKEKKNQVADQERPGTSNGGKTSGRGHSPNQAKSPPNERSRPVAKATSPVSINRYDVLVDLEELPPEYVEEKPTRSPVKAP